MSEERKSAWITKYGVPSLALSLAVFLLQQQQQTFDRLQHTVEGGWQFYSGARTPLQYADDTDRELSLLKVVGNAFPNIYCDVRQDIYERAWAARPAELAFGAASASSALGLTGVNIRAADAGRALIESTDLENLRQELVARSSPMRRKYPENVIQAWMPSMPWTVQGKDECPDLNGGKTPSSASVAGAPVAAKSAKDSKAASSAPPPPQSAPAPAETAARSAPAKPVGTSLSATADAAAGPVPASPPPSPPTAPAPQMTAMPTLMRVFFHLPANSTRDGGVAISARTELSPFNYRVMRGVERVPADRFPPQAMVRYFGPDEAKAAEQLAAYLNYRFRAENLKFHTEAIGADFPNMPRQNLEVWVPNP